MSAARRRAFVLGGGVAGLVAAFGLAERGWRVVLLESRGWLGGRAFSSPDRASGQRLDNGPHVMLGCYRAMRALLRRLGTEQGFRQDPALALSYRARGGRRFALQLSRLPVPLAMPPALLRLGLPWRATARALWGMGQSLRRAPADWTLADWLRRRAQHGEPEAFLWRPLCRAIMNVDPEHACADEFLATLREAFGGRAAAAGFWLARRPWGELIGDAAPPALATAGIELRRGARVAGLAMHGGAVAQLVLATGERLDVAPAELVVTALPWHQMRALLPEVAPPFAVLDSSPIVSAFVETAPGAPLVPDDGAVPALVDGEPFHFVLRTPEGDPRRFALLSGGDRSFDGQPVETIAARALAQLAQHYPGVDLAGAAVRVRKEQHATFVAACGTAPARPRPGRLPGGASNLRVCGDWTATGLPATLEGAARSAELMLVDERAPS